MIRKVHVGIDDADGIMFDESTNTLLSINRGHPMGTVVAVNAKTGELAGTITLGDMAPEGGAAGGRGNVFIHIEDKYSIDVVELKTMKVLRWRRSGMATSTVACAKTIAVDETLHRAYDFAVEYGPAAAPAAGAPPLAAGQRPPRGPIVDIQIRLRAVQYLPRIYFTPYQASGADRAYRCLAPQETA